MDLRHLRVTGDPVRFGPLSNLIFFSGLVYVLSTDLYACIHSVAFTGIAYSTAEKRTGGTSEPTLLAITNRGIVSSASRHGIRT